MYINRTELLDELTEAIEQLEKQTRLLKTLDEQSLEQRPHAKGWNILECVEHLLRYNRFYLPEIEARCKMAKAAPKAESYKTGWLGNMSALSMKPETDKAPKAMNTFADKNPLHAKLNRAVLEQFEQELQAWKKLLENCKELDLGANRCKLTLPLLRFKLGDTLRFVVYHQLRHGKQIEKLLLLCEK